MERIFLTLLDGGPYHTEPSALICFANEWNSFYMIGTSIMKELISLLDGRFSVNYISRRYKKNQNSH